MTWTNNRPSDPLLSMVQNSDRLEVIPYSDNQGSISPTPSRKTETFDILVTCSSSTGSITTGVTPKVLEPGSTEENSQRKGMLVMILSSKKLS